MKYGTYEKCLRGTSLLKPSVLTTYVKDQAVTNNRYRGSYNYADTMETGYDLHKKFDMDPDEEWEQDYIDENQFSSLSERIFEPQHFVGEKL